MRGNCIRIAASAALACSVMAYAGLAQADATGNVAATSEYVFRGISSSGGAAVQGGLDYSNDPTDLYVGVWGSNTAPVVADGTEVDLYGTSLNDGDGGFDNVDKPKYVVTLSKGFGL